TDGGVRQPGRQQRPGGPDPRQIAAEFQSKSSGWTKRAMASSASTRRGPGRSTQLVSTAYTRPSATALRVPHPGRAATESTVVGTNCPEPNTMTCGSTATNCSKLNWPQPALATPTVVA